MEMNVSLYEERTETVRPRRAFPRVWEGEVADYPRKTHSRIEAHFDRGLSTEGVSRGFCTRHTREQLTVLKLGIG